MLDIHCHILPDFDDGAATMEESLEMARMAWFSGVTDIAATPHFNGEPEQLQYLDSIHRRFDALTQELERNRISVEELFSQLRLKSIVSLDDVEYAILEQNGQLSVITKCNVQPVSPVDIDLEIPEKGIAHALIIDGTINEQNLQIAGKNDAWLKNKVKSYGCRIEDVFIFTIDDIGNEKLIKRDADRDTDRRKDAK